MPDNLIDLVIVRHGEAGSATTDHERSLTSYGQQQISSQYQWLVEQNFMPQIILHSPYKRTVETALLSQTLFPEAELEVEPLITPDGDPKMVQSMIPALGKQQILLISHMPMVAYLTSILVSGQNITGYPVAGLCWLQMVADGSSAKLLHQHWSVV